MSVAGTNEPGHTGNHPYRPPGPSHIDTHTRPGSSSHPKFGETRRSDQPSSSEWTGVRASTGRMDDVDRDPRPSLLRQMEPRVPTETGSTEERCGSETVFGARTLEPCRRSPTVRRKG